MKTKNETANKIRIRAKTKQDEMLNLDEIYHYDGLSLIRYIALYFYKSKVDVKILSATLAFSAGLNPMNGGPSQSDIAEEIGVSRSLINYHVKNWNSILGLP